MKGTMSDRTSRADYVDVEGGRLGYEVVGEGPLVVLSPGMGDIRSAYRFLAPLIANAGYRVVSIDLRGHGESSIDWRSYSHADTAGDLIDVIRKLGGPAVIVGQSFSGGAAAIAAATNPDLVSAIVQIAPFTRPPKISLAALLRNTAYRRGAFLLGKFVLTGRVKAWLMYLDMAYPGRKPADWHTWLATLQVNLGIPGRTKAAQKMASSMATLKVAAAQLANVQCAALVVMGRDDSDFPNPAAEALAIVALLPAGLGRYEMIDHAGHYPHAQYPQEVADVILPFLAENANA